VTLPAHTPPAHPAPRAGASRPARRRAALGVAGVRNLVVRLAGAACLAGACARAAAPAGDQRPAGAPASGGACQLVVEHDASAEVRLRAGDTLRIRPALRNAGALAVTIRHGARLFVIEARGPGPSPTGAPRPALSLESLTPGRSGWGELRRWEYPDPAGPYAALLREAALRPGEPYAPPPVGETADGYRLPFPVPGMWLLRVCADVPPARLCGGPEIRVMVTP
jgi:hypothetical protein